MLPREARRIALASAVKLGDVAAIRTVLDHSGRGHGQDARALLLDLVLRCGQTGMKHGPTLALLVAALQRPGGPQLWYTDFREVVLSLASTRDVAVLEQGFLFLAAQQCRYVPYYRALLGQMYAHGGTAQAQALLARWLNHELSISEPLHQMLTPHLLRQRETARFEAETCDMEQVEDVLSRPRRTLMPAL